MPHCWKERSSFKFCGYFPSALRCWELGHQVGFQGCRAAGVHFPGPQPRTSRPARPRCLPPCGLLAGRARAHPARSHCRCRTVHAGSEPEPPPAAGTSRRKQGCPGRVSVTHFLSSARKVERGVGERSALVRPADGAAAGLRGRPASEPRAMASEGPREPASEVRTAAGQPQVCGPRNAGAGGQLPSPAPTPPR